MKVVQHDVNSSCEAIAKLLELIVGKIIRSERRRKFGTAAAEEVHAERCVSLRGVNAAVVLS